MGRPDLRAGQELVRRTSSPASCAMCLNRSRRRARSPRRPRLGRVADRRPWSFPVVSAVIAPWPRPSGRAVRLPRRPWPRSPVGFALLVGQDGQREALAPAEVVRVARRGLPDQDELDPGGIEIRPCAIQLDRVRAAVDSAVMPEPDQRHGLVTPQVAQADRLSVVVGQHDVVEHGPDLASHTGSARGGRVSDSRTFGGSGYSGATVPEFHRLPRTAALTASLYCSRWCLLRIDSSVRPHRRDSMRPARRNAPRTRLVGVIRTRRGPRCTASLPSAATSAASGPTRCPTTCCVACSRRRTARRRSG